MENVFIINPTASTHDISDTINRKLEEAQSIADCLSIYDPCGISGALWTISDLLDDIRKLQDVFARRIC